MTRKLVLLVEIKTPFIRIPLADGEFGDTVSTFSGHEHDGHPLTTCPPVKHDHKPPTAIELQVDVPDSRTAALYTSLVSRRSRVTLWFCDEQGIPASRIQEYGLEDAADIGGAVRMTLSDLSVQQSSESSQLPAEFDPKPKSRKTAGSRRTSLRNRLGFDRTVAMIAREQRLLDSLNPRRELLVHSRIAEEAERYDRLFDRGHEPLRALDRIHARIDEEAERYNRLFDRGHEPQRALDRIHARIDEEAERYDRLFDRGHASLRALDRIHARIRAQLPY